MQQPNTSIDIAAIKDPDPPQDVPDSKTKKEAEDLQRQEWQAHIDGLIQDTAERRKYAGRIFWLLSIWLIGIFSLLLLQGFASPRHIFQLSDNVLLAAIGGTTINVIGIFLVVARYLFPSSKSLGKGRSPPT